MKRKLFLLLVSVFVAITANAQFEMGKVYIGSSLSGVGLSYNGSEKAHIGLEARGGYLFDDNLMLLGRVGYDKKESVPATSSLGVGARYYIVQNGLYLGAGVTYKHCGGNHDDFLPGVQVGYAFFINGSVTIEPELYYDQSFKNHKDFSTFGLRIGLGIYI